MTKRLEDLPDAMSVTEAAKFLGVSKNGAYEAIRRGEIPGIKIGSRFIVPKAAFIKLLAGEWKRMK